MNDAGFFRPHALESTENSTDLSPAANLAEANTKRCEGNYRSAMLHAIAAAGGTSVIEEVGLRAAAVASLVKTAKTAHAAGHTITAVNAFSSALANIFTVYKSAGYGKRSGRVNAAEASAVISRADALRTEMIGVANELAASIPLDGNGVSKDHLINDAVDLGNTRAFRRIYAGFPGWVQKGSLPGASDSALPKPSVALAQPS